MKKLIPIAVIAVFGTLTMLSCKKSDSDPTGNYTCTCKYNMFGTDTTVAFPINGLKKSQATTTCTSNQTNFRTVDSSATCTLK